MDRYMYLHVEIYFKELAHEIMEGLRRSMKAGGLEKLVASSVLSPKAREPENVRK